MPMMSIKFSAGAAVLLLALAACAPMAPRPTGVADELAQRQREAVLALRSAWEFKGRLAISQAGNGGNARIQWRQDGEFFDISLSAPITSQSWRLVRDADGVSLLGMDGGTRRGEDAETLLFEATGWRIPIEAMSRWVRGTRAAGPANLSSEAGGLPAVISQGGWTVEYRGWIPGAPPLPQKLFASQGRADVRLVIEQWQRP